MKLQKITLQFDNISKWTQARCLACWVIDKNSREFTTVICYFVSPTFHKTESKRKNYAYDYKNIHLATSRIDLIIQADTGRERRVNKTKN